ncbi:MAG TPA: helix-turn-helix domain-containing protein [Ktedonobacterales bacterium]|jgi:transcriptional regulator with XRE-family HTH domain
MARSLAEKTEWLFQNVRDPADGQLYSNARIAAKIEECMPGFTVTATTIWNIRTGKSENPSWRLIEGLAKAFGVSPLYFSEDDESSAKQTQEELALLAALRDSSVRQLALRAHGMTSASLETVLELVERVRQLEGLNMNRRNQVSGDDQQGVEPVTDSKEE